MPTCADDGCRVAGLPISWWPKHRSMLVHELQQSSCLAVAAWRSLVRLRYGSHRRARQAQPFRGPLRQRISCVSPGTRTCYQPRLRSLFEPLSSVNTFFVDGIAYFTFSDARGAVASASLSPCARCRTADAVRLHRRARVRHQRRRLRGLGRLLPLEDRDAPQAPARATRHQRAAIAHLIDMHRLTKDPE